ncbi:MAG: WbqC family protein [Sulfuriferula sp.]|nr:WbqC family protein [Sulfuriferula sp.]
MRVGIIQSNYIPWRGYFDFIASVDIFVFHDDIQYTKADWRNRNRIKAPDGTPWLTVPVHYHTVSQLICDTRINNQTHWASKHVRLLQEHYRHAPYLQTALDLFKSALEEAGTETTISVLNIAMIRRICAYLGIDTRLMLSSELDPVGTKTGRLLDMLGKLGATAYLSGPAADSYIDKQAFCRAGIQLEYKSYDYQAYPQLWGPFVGAVSVLDLIANCGPDSANYLHSHTANNIVVPGQMKYPALDQHTNLLHSNS